MKYTVLHLFSGSGGCTLGFVRAGLVSLGSLDFDPKACRDLERLTGTSSFCVDLAKLTVAELRALTGGRCPDVVVLSAPCKSFSGCMPAKRAGSEKYVKMSGLAVRGVFLALEAWAPKQPRLFFFENVPRIQTRGKALLASIVKMLQAKGYSVNQDTHDCGEVGGLAQHRQRFFFVARDLATTCDYLRRPPKKRVRAIREVLSQLPSPVAKHNDEMHRQPRLSGLNWLRLAAIRAGKDWRDIPDSIRLGGDATNRTADPRVAYDREEHGGRPDAWGVADWDRPSVTVRAQSRIQTSRSSVTDPRLNRLDHKPRRGTMGVLDLDKPSVTIRGNHSNNQASAAVVDERGWPVPTHYLDREGDELVLYGPALDLSKNTPMIIVIRAPDGTWHRPMTDRELATLQSLPIDCYLEGPTSSSKGKPGRREHIGNLIPPDAAEAVALEMIATLEASDGDGWRLSSQAVWVEERERALAVKALECQLAALRAVPHG